MKSKCEAKPTKSTKATLIEQFRIIEFGTEKEKTYTLKALKKAEKLFDTPVFNGYFLVDVYFFVNEQRVEFFCDKNHYNNMAFTSILDRPCCNVAKFRLSHRKNTKRKVLGVFQNDVFKDYIQYWMCSTVARTKHKYGHIQMFAR